MDPSGGFLAQGGKTGLRHVWRVNRHGEDRRFAAHAGMGNRHLLWHGTNVAVVAAIFKGGLRIMPHSGGRVGRGIYLADCQVSHVTYRHVVSVVVFAGTLHRLWRPDIYASCRGICAAQAKSARYCAPSYNGGKRRALMFLVEAPVGKSHYVTTVRESASCKSLLMSLVLIVGWLIVRVTHRRFLLSLQDGYHASSLKAPPPGFDSVVAKGTFGPDGTWNGSKTHAELEIDGNSVKVPQTRLTPTGVKGTFRHNEILVCVWESVQLL